MLFLDGMQAGLCSMRLNSDDFLLGWHVNVRMFGNFLAAACAERAFVEIVESELRRDAFFVIFSWCWPRVVCALCVSCLGSFVCLACLFCVFWFGRFGVCVFCLLCLCCLLICVLFVVFVSCVAFVLFFSAVLLFIFLFILNLYHSYFPVVFICVAIYVKFASLGVSALVSVCVLLSPVACLLVIFICSIVCLCVYMMSLGLLVVLVVT